MAGAPRSKSITYAALKVGEGTAYHLSGPHVFTREYSTLSLSFDVVIQAATPTALEALSVALETAYRTKNADLLVVIGGTTFVELSHSLSTGFNSRAESEATETHRTNLSRSYQCTVALELPADEAGKDFRDEASNVVETDESGIRTVSITATYTAGGGKTARENIEAPTGFPALLAAILAELEGTSEDNSDAGRVTVDDENKRGQVEATYRELFFDQSTGLRDDPELAGITYDLAIRRNAERHLAGSNAAPLTIATALFSSPVRVGQTQDLKLLVVFKILPYLTTLVKAQLDGIAEYIPGSEEWGVNPVKNTIEGAVSYSIAETTLLAATLRTRESETTGTTLIPIADGKKFTKVRHKGPATRFREVTVFTRENGAVATAHSGIVNQATKEATQAKFFLISFQDEWEFLEMKVAGTGTRREMVERASVMVFEYAEIRKGSTAVPDVPKGNDPGPTSVRKKRGTS